MHTKTRKKGELRTKIQYNLYFLIELSPKNKKMHIFLHKSLLLLLSSRDNEEDKDEEDEEDEEDEDDMMMR